MCSPLEPRIQELYHRYQPQSPAAPSAPEQDLHEAPAGTSMHISFPPRRRTLSGRPAVSSAQPRVIYL